MPLLTPIRPDIGWINAAPELFKTAWGVSTVMLAFTWWLFNQYRSSKFELLKTKLYLPIWAFVLWAFASLLWVEDGYLAAIMLVQFTSGALIFTLIVNTFKAKDLPDSLVKYLVVSMLLVSVIGLIQYYNPENYLIQNFFAQVAKPSSTFGNKNMATHFIVMVLPISMVLLLYAKNNAKIAYYSVVTIIGFWYLMNAGARQAWVAMALEISLLLLFVLVDRLVNKDTSFFRSVEKSKHKLIATVSVVFCLIFVANLEVKGSFHRGSEKIEFVKKINVEGVSSRFPAWVNTLEMIKEQPLLGVGVGQWPQSYPLYYDRKMKDTFFNEKVQLERLHNDYLEMLANFGLVGYALLIWIVFLIFARIWRVLIDTGHQYRLLILGISMGLLGFSAVAFVSFPVRVYLPAFLVLVYFAMIVLLSKPVDRQQKSVYQIHKKSFPLVLTFMALLTAFVSFFSYRWVLAEHHHSNAVIFKQIGESRLHVKAGMQALNYNNFAPKNYIRVAEGLIKLGHTDTALLYLKKAIDISPFNTRALFAVAQIYRIQGSKQDLQQERKILEFILSFDAKNVRSLAYLVRNLVESGDSIKAGIVYQRMKDGFEYFKDRSNFGPYEDIVAQVSVSVGDYQYAHQVYQHLVDRDKNAQNLIKLATVEYYYLDQKERAVERFKEALKIDGSIDSAGKIKTLIEQHQNR